MKVINKNPPREFMVGTHEKFPMKDCAEIILEDDEQVTFKTNNGNEYDFAKKSWGYYASPSLNGRLITFDYRACLIRNKLSNRYFILVVEKNHEYDFYSYLKSESCEIIIWMDDTKNLNKIKQYFDE